MYKTISCIRKKSQDKNNLINSDIQFSISFNIDVKAYFYKHYHKGHIPKILDLNPENEVELNMHEFHKKIIHCNFR